MKAKNNDQKRALEQLEIYNITNLYMTGEMTDGGKEATEVCEFKLEGTKLKLFIIFIQLYCLDVAFSKTITLVEEDKNGSLDIVKVLSIEKGPTDLVLFPKSKGTIISYGHYYQATKYNWERGDKEFLHHTNKEIGIDLEVMHAFDDYWAFSVLSDYQMYGSSNNSYGPASSNNGEILEYESKGISEPTFSITYRAFDMERNDSDLNLYLKFSPKTENSKIPSTTKDGDNLQGGPSTTVGIEWGKKRVKMSWSIGIDLNKKGEAKFKSQTNGNTTVLAPFLEANVFSKFQWTTSKKISLNLFMIIRNAADVKYIYADNSTLTYGGGNDFSIEPGINYLLHENVYFNFKLRNTLFGARAVKSSNGLNVTESDRLDQSYRAGVVVEF